MNASVVAVLRTPELKEVVRRAVMAGANGAPTSFLSDWSAAEPSAKAKALIVEADDLPHVLPDLPDWPSARVVVLTPDIPDAMLAAALREPRLVGFVAVGPQGPRSWELSYLTRRLVLPKSPEPMAGDLLSWGAATVSWRPRTSEDRDRTVEGVDVVAKRFGMSQRAAAAAAEAAHELLMNAMYDAPTDAAGQPLYAADRRAAIRLDDAHLPTLRLTVDADYLCLDIVDPFGGLPRQKVFGGVLRGRRGATSTANVLDVSHGGAGLGLFKLQTSAQVFRAVVQPGRQTLVSWIRDRSLSARDERAASRSLYFLEQAE